MAASLKLTSLTDQGGGKLRRRDEYKVGTTSNGFHFGKNVCYFTSAPSLSLYQVALTFIITQNRGVCETLSCRQREM